MTDIVILAGSNNKNLELGQEFEKYFNLKGIKSSVLDLVALELPLYTPVRSKTNKLDFTHSSPKDRALWARINEKIFTSVIFQRPRDSDGSLASPPGGSARRAF